MEIHGIKEKAEAIYEGHSSVKPHHFVFNNKQPTMGTCFVKLNASRFLDME